MQNTPDALMAMLDECAGERSEAESALQTAWAMLAGVGTALDEERMTLQRA